MTRRCDWYGCGEPLLATNRSRRCAEHRHQVRSHFLAKSEKSERWWRSYRDKAMDDD